MTSTAVTATWSQAVVILVWGLSSSTLFAPVSEGQRLLSTRPLLQSYYHFSHESPYSAQFNFFGAYQYCRSLGMALISFESVEEVETIYEYLKNTSADKQEFWTSGNVLGTKDREFVQWIWMSTGSPYNASVSRFWGGSGSNFYTQAVQGRQQSQFNAADPNASNPYANQDCMQMAPGPLFQPASCDRRLQYICESAQYFFVNQRPVINPKSYSRTLSGFTQRQITIQDISTSPILAILNSTFTQKLQQLNFPDQKNNETSQNSSAPSTSNDCKDKRTPCVRSLFDQAEDPNTGNPHYQPRRRNFNLTFQIRAPAAGDLFSRNSFIIGPSAPPLEGPFSQETEVNDSTSADGRKAKSSSKLESNLINHSAAEEASTSASTETSGAKSSTTGASEKEPGDEGFISSRGSTPWWDYITPRQEKQYWKHGKSA